MTSYTGDTREQLQSQSLRRCRRKLFCAPAHESRHGNARRDARNHVKIKFPVAAARNTPRGLISDSHNTPTRRIVTVPAFVPS